MRFQNTGHSDIRRPDVCPLCGGELIQEYLDTDVYVIACYNSNCPVNPMEFASDQQRAELRWDVRYSDFVRLLSAIRSGKYRV